jgi:hypothetical protein
MLRVFSPSYSTVRPCCVERPTLWIRSASSTIDSNSATGTRREVTCRNPPLTSLHLVRAPFLLHGVTKESLALVPSSVADVASHLHAFPVDDPFASSNDP